MVATTFAADTPLAVTGLVAKGGIAGNWLWWNFVAGGMMTVFFYARLWRRSGVTTDIEFSELRYSGKPAAFLRGFRALYLGIPINCIILGWVNLAMVKIAMLTLGITKVQALAIVMGLIALTSFISTMSGLWGVLVTDVFQFIVKMGMVTALAVFAVRATGGMDTMKDKLHALDLTRGGQGSVLNFVPDLNSAWMPMMAFFVYIGVNWWATWYPGAEPGGGGYIAQRMMCAKDERHSLLATLWFNIAHYAIRPWPWVLAALASLVLYPNLQDKESGYVMVMVDYLPASLRGLMIAAFAAAYMSTIATQLNWGASYVVNDFYRRFMKTDAPDHHYVKVAQLATVLITIISAVLSYFLESIGDTWQLLLGIGAGTGGVLLLRWYWWRISAWSEIAAMSAALVVSTSLRFMPKLDANPEIATAKATLLTVAITTATWLIATYATAPESLETLRSFYARVHPSYFGWKPIADAMPEVAPSRSGLWNLADAIAGCVMIYGTLFGIGKIIFGDMPAGLSMLAIAVGGGAFIYWDLSRRGWKTVVD
jgi:Na+/proline symporter